jgi:hypothetical protein
VSVCWCVLVYAECMPSGKRRVYASVCASALLVCVCSAPVCVTVC